MSVPRLTKRRLKSDSEAQRHRRYHRFFRQRIKLLEKAAQGTATQKEHKNLGIDVQGFRQPIQSIQ